jgi:hypothetical protein
VVEARSGGTGLGAPRPGPAAYGLFSAALAASLTAALTRRGLLLTPDGWAYWEGAVSLLSGRGYAYFGGQPIHAFPPLFSGLIALASAMLGVSGATLAVLLAWIAACAAFGWTVLYVRWSGDSSARFWKTTIAIATALWVGFWCQSLLADTLGLALIAPVSWAVARCGERGRDGAPVVGTGALVTLAVSLGALVVTRHAGLALVPAAATVALVISWRAPAIRRQGIVIAAIVIPLAIAAIVAAAVGQLHSRTVALGVARYTPADYAEQIANGFADLVAHPVLRAGKWVVAIVSAIAFVLALARLRARNDEAARGTLAVAALALLGLLSTAVLFNLTWVHDELRGRFLWSLPLVLIGTLAVAASRGPAGRPRGWALVAALIATLVTALAAGRAGVGVVRALERSAPVDVTASTTIRVDHVDRPPVAAGRHTLVSPPSYPWIDRHPAGMPPTDH